MKKLLYILGFNLVLALLLGGTVGAKSLYVLSNHHLRQFQAWNIPALGTPVTYQGSYSLNYALYPAGVAIHEPSKTLFISSESNNLEVVDATTFDSLGQLSGNQFAGIAVDDKNDIFYGIKRYPNQLYAYNFNRTGSTWTLTLRPGFPMTLPGLFYGYGMGIALDELSDPAILWVADAGNMMVRAYDTTTWLEISTQSFSTASTGKGAVGMGIDRQRKIIYWGSMNWGAGVPLNSGSYDLYKFDLATKVLTHTDIGTGVQVVDVSVDEETGLVYITETRALSVWDTSTWPWAMLDRHTTGGTQTFSSTCGLAVTNVSYQPDLTVDKTDDVDDGDCRYVGENITYTIDYENTGDADLTGVTLVDNLPLGADPVPGHSGIYDILSHTITWDIGDLAEGASGSVSFTVQVNTAVPGTHITNYATIDSDTTNPTTVDEKTDICLQQQTCDVNNDGAIDIDDIIDIGKYRGSSDPADLAIYDMDSDGVVTTNDARTCVLDCDNLRCAR